MLLSLKSVLQGYFYFISDLIYCISAKKLVNLIESKVEVMENHILQSTLSPAERKFLDLMVHGDNFFRIELLRPAKKYYKLALELNLETEKVKQKIADCDRLLAYEIKVIRILVVISVLVIASILIFGK